MMGLMAEYVKRGIYSTKAFYQYYIRTSKRYRANIFLKLLGFPVRFIVMFFLWSIVLTTADENFQYYIWYYIGVFLILLMYPYVRVANATVGQDVFTGEITKYISKGIPYWSVRLADWLVVVQWYVPVAIGIYICGVFMFIDSFNIDYLFFFIYLLLIGSLTQLTMWTIAGLSAFWLNQTNGMLRLFSFAQELLTGALIPLHLLPMFIQDISKILPFQYYLYIPLQVLMDRIPIRNVIHYCFISTGWFVFMLVAAYLIWKKGIRHYESPLT